MKLVFIPAHKSAGSLFYLKNRVIGACQVNGELRIRDIVVEDEALLGKVLIHEELVYQMQQTKEWKEAKVRI